MVSYYDPGRIEIKGGNFQLPMMHRMGFYRHHAKPRRLLPHIHDGPEITFAIKGGVTWELADGSQLSLEGGDLALTQPGVIHHGKLNIIEPATIFWLVLNFHKRNTPGTGFNDDEYSEIQQIFREAGSAVWYGGKDISGLLPMVYGLLREITGAQRSDVSWIALAGLRSLVCCVITRAAAIVRRERHERQPETRIKRIIEYMTVNSQESIRLNEIASFAGLSKGRLHAVFLKETGFTPNDYLIRIRIRKAQTLLADTEMPVSRVAPEAGFASTQYFATCFKKCTGMQPIVYRKMIRNDKNV